MGKVSNTTAADARRLDEASAALRPIVVTKERVVVRGPSRGLTLSGDRRAAEIDSAPDGRTGFECFATGPNFGASHDARSAMDRMTGHLVQHGLYSPGDLTPEQARGLAQTCAHRKDSHLAGEADADRSGRHPVTLGGPED